MDLLATHAITLSRPRAAQRETLGWCLLWVLAAHALLVVATVRPHAVAAAAPAPMRAVQVRLVPSGEAPRAMHASALQAAAAPRVASRSGDHRRAAPPAAAAAVARADAVAADADTRYLSRAALSLPPKPMVPVVIDYPYFDGEADHYTGEFELFIDDSGAVVRVVDATPGLPGILGHAVLEAFLAARFAPGEVDGRPVRSRVRIEVTFDSQR